MLSFLSDMKPEVVANLYNNHSNQFVIFSLVIESLELHDPSGAVAARFQNDPYSPDFENFQWALYSLVRGGLDVEQFVSSMPLSAPMDAAEVNRNLMGIAAASVVPGTILMPAQLANGAPGFQLVRMAPGAKICLRKTYADEILPFKLSPSSYCKSIFGGGVSNSSSDTKASNDDLPARSLVIKLRSVRNVFEFLGSVVNLQNQDTPIYVKIVPDTDLDPKTSRDAILSKARPLLIVTKGAPKGVPVASVKYQGEEYFIPKDSLGYSNQVLSLVSQMLTLTKVPGSIPVSPAVLLK
jgi:hypothetical protein